MKKEKKIRREPWMLLDEYHLIPPIYALCESCQNNCKQRGTAELECEFHKSKSDEKQS